MRRISWTWITAAGLIAAAGGFGGAHWVATRTRPAPAPTPRAPTTQAATTRAVTTRQATTRAAPSPQGGPVARVVVAPIVHGTIQETLTAYGVVVAAVGKTDVISVPFECRVQQVLVSEGQRVDAGTHLIDIEPSPSASLELENAKAQRDTAKAELQLAKERFKLKLNTRPDVVKAQQKYDNARRRVQNLEGRGIDSARSLSAKTAGVVTHVVARKGQIVAAGSTLIETVGENQIDVRLGIESEDVNTLHAGQAVRLVPVNARGGGSVAGTINLVTHRVNPSTRLVDVFVRPAPNNQLLLDQYIEVQIVVSSATGLLVPRAAILPEQDRYVLFTVGQGHAAKHDVILGLENAQQVQVLGSGLRPGQEVVVVGNSQLKDGMAVKLETAP